MASTYSALKIELIATGEQSGTWGTTTNNNLGNDALGEAITGSADVAFSSADVTVTLTDSNVSQTARNLRLNLTGTSGGARQLILGAGCQIEKLYLINNGLADAVTVKNTSGTGIVVPAGKTMFVFNNGTNVVDAITYVAGLATSGANSDITSLSGLATPLSIAQGGTGTSSTTFTNLATNVTGTLPIANGGTGSTSTAFVNAATNITGTLPIANGGTGATTLAAATISTLGYTTTVTAAGTTTLTASSTATQFFTGATTQTVVLPVTSTLIAGQEFVIHNNSTGSLTINSSGANLVGTLTANTTATITCILTTGTTAASWDFDLTGFTTALPVARGGTGLTTLGSANQVLAVNAGATALEFQTASGGQFQTELFTSPGTWTKPSSASQVRVTVIGGGGGGGVFNGAGSIQGGSGGSSGLAIAIVPVSAPVTITVGTGGNGAPNNGGTGGSGSTSSFGPAVSCTGGTGGGGGSPGSNGAGTVSVGTTLRTGISGYTAGTSQPVYNSFSTAGTIVGGSNKLLGTPTGGSFSNTGIFAAGAAGQFWQSPTAPPSGQGGGGGGGAILVEFVG
jgi:hypothetical protein